MSCLNSVSVINPSRFFVPSRDRAQISAPCGKCSACQNASREQWAVRGCFEFDAAQKKGYSMMLLLTYNEYCVPRFNILSPIKSTQYCFNSHDVHRFIDSLKKYFKRKHLGKLTYFISSEYGENNTERPHYHSQFHIYEDKISPEDFRKLVQHYWPYGMVSPGMFSNDLVIKSYKGILYNSKYITKDLDFYGLQIVKDIIKDKGLTKSCKHCFPRHYQSKSYGSVFLEKIENSSTEDIIKILTEGYSLPFDTTVLAIPRYITKKLIYNQTKVLRNGSPVLTDLGNPVYKTTLTPFGFAYKAAQFDKIYNNKLSDINNIIDNIGSVVLDDFNSLSPFSINDTSDLQKLVKNLLAGRSSESLALYSLYLKDKQNDYTFLKNGSWFLPFFEQDPDFSSIYSTVKFDYLNKLKINGYAQNKISPKTLNYYLTHTFNSDYNFRYFDELLYLLNIIKSCSTSYKFLKEFNDDKATKFLKHFYEISQL